MNTEKVAPVPRGGLTLKAVMTGLMFGLMFGVANAYLGLRIGLTIGAAIPIAVISMALLRAIQGDGGNGLIYECNIAQSAGTASSALSSGIIFTIPALFLWGTPPSLIQMCLLSLIGGGIGLIFAIPLRELFIIKEKKQLPYPEGSACAQLLTAMDSGGKKARWVTRGIGIGAAGKTLTSFIRILPDRLATTIPGIPGSRIGFELSLALLGVGYIVGFRISSITIAGGIVTWLGLIPLIHFFGQYADSPIMVQGSLLLREMSPEQIWFNYIRYIGAGAVTCAGCIMVFKTISTMIAAVAGSFRSIRSLLNYSVQDRVSPGRDLPPLTLIMMFLSLLALLFLNTAFFGVQTPPAQRVISILCSLVFGGIFTAVSARVAGIVGVSSNPTSGMAIVTLMATSAIFLGLNWLDSSDKASIMYVGTIVCIAAGVAGNVAQDYKTGNIIGTIPMKQQFAQIVGVGCAALVIPFSVWIIGKLFTFGSAELPVPQATLMKTVVEGVLQAQLPWHLVSTGAVLALSVELLGVPSLPFSIGVYLPISSITPIFVGGCIRYLMERQKKGACKGELGNNNMLFSAGLIAGEGLVTVLMACTILITGTAFNFELDIFKQLESKIISIILFTFVIAYMCRIDLGKTKGKD